MRNDNIRIFDLAGEFAEDKDKAREIRVDYIIPALETKQDVILDFEDVNLSTQSFIHALISDIIRNFGIDILDRLFFKNCNDRIKVLVNIVVEYMQWGTVPDGVKVEIDDA